MAPDSNDGKLPVITSKFLQVSSPSSRLQVCPCKNHSEELNGLYNLVFVLKLSVKWLLHALLGIDTNLSHVMGDRQHYHNLKNSHSKCLQCQTLPKKKKKVLHRTQPLHWHIDDTRFLVWLPGPLLCQLSGQTAPVHFFGITSFALESFASKAAKKVIMNTVPLLPSRGQVIPVKHQRRATPADCRISGSGVVREQEGKWNPPVNLTLQPPAGHPLRSEPAGQSKHLALQECNTAKQAFLFPFPTAYSR